MCGVSLRGYGNLAWWQKTVASQKHFLDASSAYCMCTFLFYLSLLCLLCFLFFFPFPHAVPKRALQRDKYGSQTKHCLSNVIDFGFTFFSLNADKGVMKKKEILIPFGSNDILSNRPVKISLNRILNSPAVCTTWCKTGFKHLLFLTVDVQTHLNISCGTSIYKLICILSSEYWTSMPLYVHFFISPFTLIKLIHFLKLSCQIFRRSDCVQGLVGASLNYRQTFALMLMAWTRSNC